MSGCCNLVGNFKINAPGIVSVSSKGDTATQLISANGQNALTIAPSTGTVSISAYASYNRYRGCPGRAGVSIPWITKSDCNKYIYLFGGFGKSYIAGEVGGYAIFPQVAGIPNPVSSFKVVSASSSSGPAALYENSTQQDGFGLIYEGYPWSVNTSTEGGCKINLTSYGIGDYGLCYLQSLNIQCTPGQVPIVNMDFIYSISN